MRKYYPTQIYMDSRGTLQEAVANLSARPLEKEDFIGHFINQELNSVIVNNDPDDTLVPYIGWFWRYTDFAGGNISIGDSPEGIGVMENNKWDYPERYLTKDEADTFTGLVWKAYQADRAGGNLAEIKKSVRGHLLEAGDFIRGLSV